MVGLGLVDTPFAPELFEILLGLRAVDVNLFCSVKHFLYWGS
jgi:hypothetical protein